MSLVDDLLTDLEENEQVEDDNASYYTVQNKQNGLIVKNRVPIPDSIQIDGGKGGTMYKTIKIYLSQKQNFLVTKNG